MEEKRREKKRKGERTTFPLEWDSDTNVNVVNAWIRMYRKNNKATSPYCGEVAEPLP
jgi:hypothetical protein